MIFLTELRDFETKSAFFTTNVETWQKIITDKKLKKHFEARRKFIH